ncbi:MAG: cytochrome c [Gallionella sp.]
MKLLVPIILLLATANTQARPFSDGNAHTGKILFDQSQCNRCHSAILGGDGSAIFTRAPRKVHRAAALTTQIKLCGGNVLLPI